MLTIRTCRYICMSKHVNGVNKKVCFASCGLALKGELRWPSMQRGPSFTVTTTWSSLRLMICFANAFNSIHHDKALEAVSEHLPSLFSYIYSSYGASSFLAYGNHLVS